MEKQKSGPAATSSFQLVIAVFTVAMIIVYLVLAFGLNLNGAYADAPLWAALAFGGIPLVGELLMKLLRGEFGSDLLAGISIVTSVLLGEYLAGALVVLMLSGGEALEAYAVRSASSVLQALSKRMPSTAHRKADGKIEDIPVDAIRIGDLLAVFPHEICPVDGSVVEGHGVMDESYLTGEPYMLSKTPGSAVLSGAINGEAALTIRAEKLAVDSRYAKIVEVMQASEENRPKMRRIADRLGAWYTPIAVLIGIAGWAASGDPVRFLAVMVVATPCPLLIAIPVAIIGSISLAARRSIIIRDPAALETADTCRTLIFDKTGTLTYGHPNLVEQVVAVGRQAAEVLSLVGSLERYSKHPLAQSILSAAESSGVLVRDAVQISEKPGQGLTGIVDGHRIQVTSRKKWAAQSPSAAEQLPPQVAGMECIIMIDDEYAATYRFRDTPRSDGKPFIRHLLPKHDVHRTLLVSGDRESEVRYLAEQVGIEEVYFSQSPEEKLAIVNREMAESQVMFVGDGINDAPALIAATVGVAFGQNSDVTTEAADVIVLDSSLERIDELLHISRRMRRIALQSAFGGMALSLAGMMVAVAGYLPPVAGAICQEVIDVIAVLNALRVAIPPKSLVDFQEKVN